MHGVDIPLSERKSELHAMTSPERHGKILMALYQGQCRRVINITGTIGAKLAFDCVIVFVEFVQIRQQICHGLVADV